MSSHVRSITEDEVAEYLGCLRTGFLGEREVTKEEADWYASRMDLSRVFAAFSDDALCGTSRTIPLELTVPGGSIHTAGVTEITVLPTETRKGHLTRMMKAMLDDARRRSEPAAILTASQWSIYGRFGFGVASERITFEVQSRDAHFTSDPAGTVEMVGVHDLRSEAAAVYEKLRYTTVGAISRDPEWWDKLLNVVSAPGSTPAKTRVRVLWRDPDGFVGGYAVYDTVENWTDGIPRGEIHLRELMAGSGDAYTGLWRYLCGIDLAATVRAGNRPLDEPLPHLLSDGRAVRYKARLDHLWLCMLDVAECLRSRRYSAPGRLVVQVRDRNERTGRTGPNQRTGRNEPRYVIDAALHETRVELTQEPADVVVDHDALGAAYLGGVSFSTLRVARRAEERVAGAIARADAMFSVTPKPFLTTSF